MTPSDVLAARLVYRRHFGCGLVKPVRSSGGRIPTNPSKGLLDMSTPRNDTNIFDSKARCAPVDIQQRALQTPFVRLLNLRVEEPTQAAPQHSPRAPGHLAKLASAVSVSPPVLADLCAWKPC